MNPNTNPTPPADPTNNSPMGTPPAPSAGDEAALKAIEALETESNEVATTPSTIEPTTPPSPSLSEAPAPTPAPSNTGPVITEPLVPPTTPATPPETGLPATPSTPATDPTPATNPNPIADSLKKEAPAAATGAAAFQPFAKPKTSKKKIIILVVVLVVLILGAGGYFGWQYLQTQSTPAPAQITTPTVTEDVELTDTEETVTATADDIESELSGMDDTEYADTTLSDSTLYN
jgi:UPF0755 protein